jgi:hypothetical protein
MSLKRGWTECKPLIWSYALDHSVPGGYEYGNLALKVVGVSYWIQSHCSELCRSEMRTDVAQALQQFRNPEEWECPPLEAITGGLGYIQQTMKK